VASYSFAWLVYSSSMRGSNWKPLRLRNAQIHILSQVGHLRKVNKTLCCEDIETDTGVLDISDKNTGLQDDTLEFQ